MTAEPLLTHLAAAAMATQSSSRGVRRARVRLLDRMEQQSLRLAQHRIKLTMIGTSPSDDLRNLNCARTALSAYYVRASLEEIESALVRIDLGVYGICQACTAPISVERLDAIPETPFCGDCATQPSTASVNTSTPL